MQYQIYETNDLTFLFYLFVCLCSLFEDLPQSKVLFGFPIDMDFEEMSGSKRFSMHSSFLIGMIEKALNQLGVANDELTAAMEDLGKKHVVYGVEPDYFPFMKTAITRMLHEMLSVKFTEKDESAWNEVLSVLISDMTKAQRELAMEKQVKKAQNAK